MKLPKEFDDVALREKKVRIRTVEHAIDNTLDKYRVILLTGIITEPEDKEKIKADLVMLRLFADSIKSELRTIVEARE